MNDGDRGLLSQCEPAFGPLDRARLSVLSNAELEIADEDGFLRGNQQYQDLRYLEIEDLAWAVNHEAKLLSEISSHPDPAEAETRLYASRSMEDERESLWHLDLGVAAATLAVIVLGGHPYLSCNGGSFGNRHHCDRPQIRFFVQSLDLDRLASLATACGAVLGQREDILVLHAEQPQQLLAFGRAVLAAADPPRQEADP